MARLVILENNLRERFGHFLNSTLGLANGALNSSFFNDVAIYGHRRASDEVTQLTGAIPLFRHTSWKRKFGRSPAKSIEILGSIFAEDCHAIGTLSADDVVLIPTTQENQIYGLSRYLDQASGSNKPQFVLNFHNDNITGNAEREAVIRQAFQQIKSNNLSRILLTAPTDNLTNQLATLCGDFPCKTYPLPQNYDLKGANDESSIIDSGRTTVAIMGRPIRRKGAANVAKIVLQASRASSGIDFIVQSTLRAPGVLRMAVQQNVRLELGGLSPNEYGNLIGRADIVLIPYDVEAYKHRTSGIFADAAAFGKIVVVPDGTWMARQIHEGRASGKTYGSDSAVSVSNALLSAVEEQRTLATTARARMEYWHRHQNATSYVSRLCSELSATTT